jgi:succinoglycan biosynthesis transport protein ExoP
MMPNETEDIRYYISILRYRKKYFFIPALVVLVVAILVARLLPSTYESTSTILIEEQQIPQEFVRSTVTGFADQRIQSLTQQILSRAKLLEIIQQFNLYQDLKKKITQDEIIEKMRDNVKLKTISADVADRRGRSQAAVTIAFSIAYRGKNPDTVQKVDGTLASLYLEQNLKTREAQAKTTTKFLEAELKELQERIKVLGDKITAFKETYDGLLPDQQRFNQQQAEGLDLQNKQLESNIRAAEERRLYLQGQIATVNPETPIIGETGERIMAPADRLKALELKLVDLRAKFSDDYPDVQKTRREIAQLKKMTGQTGGSADLRRKKLAQLQAQLAEMQGKYSDQHPEVKKLKNEISKLEQEPATASSPQPANRPDNPTYISLTTQIKAADTDIASLRSQQAAIQAKLRMYRQRLEEAPKVEQEYLALTRDYQNASSKHQEVMNKILEARIAEGMEEHQKGEKFTLIDPANYPEKPVSPNRWLIMLAGLILSLGGGFGTVALVEHLDHSVKSSDELVQLTGLPVLGSIIRIQTKEDITRASRKRRLIWIGTGFTLIMGLVLFHFFYMNLWVFTAKLLNLVNKYS